MLSYTLPQKVCHIGGLKVGGQPGENPPPLIGNMFQKGDILVESRKEHKFNQKAAQERIHEMERLSRETGVPGMVAMVANTPDEIKAYVDFFVSVTDMPFAIDIWVQKTRLAAIESPTVLHICGETNDIVEQMAHCGADAISVDQKNRLSESRDKVGADTILLGNIDPYNVLVKGKPEKIDQVVKEIIASGANAVWPGCDIWPTVPRQNMEALVTATQKYGRKPR